MPELPRTSASTVRRLALASVVANCVIVVTGGAVRLTGSGLGCPTWPRCTGQSYVPTQAQALHGAIEFGNRMLTFVLTVVVILTFLAAVRARHRRRSLVGLSLAALLGIPAQAVLGGITVLTGLNPWTVAGHFVLSMGLIALGMVLWHRATQGVDTPPVPVVRPELAWLVRGLVAATAVTLAVGAVVTGSGPHAGDRHAVRTGLDPAMMSQLHADVVMLLVGMSVATWVALRATAATSGVRRAAAVLIGVELAQGAIGYTQYFTGLPSLLVGAHLVGACLVWVAALRLLLVTRVRTAATHGVVAQPTDSTDRVAVPAV